MASSFSEDSRPTKAVARYGGQDRRRTLNTVEVARNLRPQKRPIKICMRGTAACLGHLVKARQ